MNNSSRGKAKETGTRGYPSLEKPETVLTILEDFCGYTTSGGLGRVLGSKYFVFKILWIVLFLGALTAGILQLAALFATFQRKPIGTRISLEHSHSLPFPSVTFCNFNMIRQSQLVNLPNYLRQGFDDYGKKSNVSANSTAANNTNTSALDDDDEGYVDPDALDDKQREAEKISRLLAQENWKTLMPLGHQFRDMIHSCKFKGKDCRNTVAANKYWDVFWHYKFGNCYTFNPKFIGGVQQKVLKASNTGPFHGLSLQLDIEQKEYLEQLAEDAGIVVHISPRGQMAFPYEQGLSLAPGFATSVGVRMVHIFRSDRFKNGSCVNQNIQNNNNIYTRAYNVSYSKIACIQSCIANNQKKECGCMEYKFNPQDKIVCDSLNRTTVNCLRGILSKARTNKLNCTTGCPPSCKEEVYKITSSFSTWPSSKFKKFLSQELENDNRNHSETGGLSNNLLKVKIFYQDLNYEKIQEEISYGLANFVADIGGQLGLWLGVSVLTGAEVVELIILIILHLCKRKNGKHKNHNGIAMEEGRLR